MTSHGSTSNSLGFEELVSSLLAASLECQCRPRTRRMQKNWQFSHFGSLFKIIDVEESHFRGCSFNKSSLLTTRERQVGIRFTGLRRLCRKAIQMSVTLAYGAGGYSMGKAASTWFPMVDARIAPAWRIVGVLASLAAHLLEPRMRSETTLMRWKEFAALAFAKILWFFCTNAASPLDVNENNQSLICELLDSVSLHFLYVRAGHNADTLQYGVSSHSLLFT